MHLPSLSTLLRKIWERWLDRASYDWYTCWRPLPADAGSWWLSRLAASFLEEVGSLKRQLSAAVVDALGRCMYGGDHCEFGPRHTWLVAEDR